MNIKFKKVYKPLISILMIICLLISFVSCNIDKNKNNIERASESQVLENFCEIALITDHGSIDDRSFNQSSWEGIVKFATEKKISYKNYKTENYTLEAHLSAIELAVFEGAKIIVLPSVYFGEAVYNAQKIYPDIKFIILDGFPHKGDNVPSIADNTKSFLFAEEQAGFLAGYAIIYDGYRDLGFLGGVDTPSVKRFGYGFAQGIQYASKQIGLSKDSVKLKYKYVGNFLKSDENKYVAMEWYNSGTEVIFACGGALGGSVMEAAELTLKSVVGVDVDQSSESSSVITSAMKNIMSTVYDAIASIYDNKFESGSSVVLDVSSKGVSLPFDTSKFKKFTKSQYMDIYNELSENKNNIATNIKKDSDISSIKELDLSNLTIEVL